MSDKADKVKRIIADKLIVELSLVHDEAGLKTDLSADSLDAVELIMALEDEFKINVPDADAEKMVTVGDVVKYIEDHVA